MSIFGNNPQGNIFGGNSIQPKVTNGIFSNNQPQQGGNMFSNQTQGNILNQQQGMNGFNQGGQQQKNLFNQGQQQGQQTGNIFGGNNQTQQGGNMLNLQQKPGMFNQTPQQGQGQNTGIFGNQQQGNPMLNTQQQQPGNIFNANQQQQGATNIFGGNQQQQVGTSIFGNQPNNPMVNLQQQQQQQQQMAMNITFNPMNSTGTNDLEKLKFQIQEYCRRIDPKNLQHIRIDQLNMFKEERLGNLSPQLKNYILVLMNNMKDLRNAIDKIKAENDELDKKASQYCKNVQQKLVKYKECLIHNVSQSNLLEQVKQQIELIQNQVNGFIIPLYNAHKSGKHHSFDSPDQFSSTVSKKILQKMIELNNKVDEIISCQQNTETDAISEQDSNTLVVLEQLLNYYQNVSAKVLQFSTRYNSVKKTQIQKHKRSASYEQIMRRIQDKVENKMKKDFKAYDLIKEIQEILHKREKRQQEMAYNHEKLTDKRATRQFGNQPSYRWGKY